MKGYRVWTTSKPASRTAAPVASKSFREPTLPRQRVRLPVVEARDARALAEPRVRRVEPRPHARASEARLQPLRHGALRIPVNAHPIANLCDLEPIPHCEIVETGFGSIVRRPKDFANRTEIFVEQC